MQVLDKKKRFTKIFLAIVLPIIILVVGLIYLIIPRPYYIEKPGVTLPLSGMVKVEGKSAEKKGNFYLTAVTVMPANNALMIASHFDSFSEIISDKDMTGGLNNQQYNLVNQYYMETAQNMAIYQAFKLADKAYSLDYQGVYVLSITDNSTFKKDLQISDTVTAVNGKSFKSSQGMINYVASQKVGDPVTIEVTRIDGVKHSFKGKYIKLSSGKTGIGIGLVDHTKVKTDPAVKIDAGSIGGPSAGMMFTLETYDQLTGNQLLQGRSIAGTGTIEEDGSIGQIGGIDQKIASASRSGATVFFAPDSGTKKELTNNYLGALSAAKRLKTKMKIIPVKKVQDALDYLKK
ncbi:MAG TPA: SepM family pheromone-processing serine protease [Lactovum miscens]|nr:SepM family pheromone-processing serine protease [Lactovum miscens]